MVRKHRLLSWLQRGGVGLFLVLGQLLPVSVAQANAVTVTVDAPAEVRAGDGFGALVNITGVTDFDACDYVVVFDSSILRLDNVGNGDIGGYTIPISATSELSPGHVKVVANVPGTPGVTGSGSLAVLHFHALNSGNSNIEFEDGTLSDNTATRIPATWVGDSVNVHAYSTPSPSSDIEATELVVSPSQVEAGEEVNIEVDVSNKGSAKGSYQVVLRINGITETTREVSVPGKESITVTFAVSRQAEGSYVVEVNGLSEKFTVRTTSPSSPSLPSPPLPPLPPSPPPGSNWPLIGGIIGGVIVVGVIIVYLLKRT